MDTRSVNIGLHSVAQAAEFFIEFRVGDSTPATRVRFEKWLRASPEHVHAYLDVSAGWCELPNANLQRHLDLQALLAAARSSDDNVVQLRTSQAGAGGAGTPRRTWAWAIAASLALMAILIGGELRLFAFQGCAYSTGIGEQRTLLLGDGSTVMLSALTTVRVHISKYTREVTLVRGEAYFHDVDEPDRPFIVHSGDSTVRAIGTEFNVDRELDRTVVTVLEGQVAVARAYAQTLSIERRALLRELAGPAKALNGVLVPAGEQVTILGQGTPSPKFVNIGVVIAWTHKSLVFDNTPLEKVAEQFNLYNKRRLIIAAPSLQNVGVSGVYSASDPAALIGFLRSQPALRIVETDDEILVTARQLNQSPPLLN